MSFAMFKMKLHGGSWVLQMCHKARLRALPQGYHQCWHSTERNCASARDTPVLHYSAVHADYKSCRELNRLWRSWGRRLPEWAEGRRKVWQWEGGIFSRSKSSTEGVSSFHRGSLSAQTKELVQKWIAPLQGDSFIQGKGTKVPSPHWSFRQPLQNSMVDGQVLRESSHSELLRISYLT